MGVTDSRDLEVHGRAVALPQRAFEGPKAFPESEASSLTDHVRRASRSVGPRTAAAWKKRRHPNHFASKLADSDIELAETPHGIRPAHACGYAAVGTAFHDESAQIGRVLGAVIRDAGRRRTAPPTARRRPDPFPLTHR